MPLELLSLALTSDLALAAHDMMPCTYRVTFNYSSWLVMPGVCIAKYLNYNCFVWFLNQGGL